MHVMSAGTPGASGPAGVGHSFSLAQSYRKTEKATSWDFWENQLRHKQTHALP